MNDESNIKTHAHTHPPTHTNVCAKYNTNILYMLSEWFVIELLLKRGNDRLESRCLETSCRDIENYDISNRNEFSVSRIKQSMAQ